MSNQPPSPIRIFITGATGFLGSHFLLRFIESGPDGIYALIRGENLNAIFQKFQNALGVAAGSYTPSKGIEKVLHSTSLCQGDIEREECGVSGETIHAIRAHGPIDSFWHFAGSLNWEEGKRERITAHNIDGTRNALALAQKLQAKRFIHISTAYTAGAREGFIREALHPLDAEFSNYYEESKCRAEHIVAEFCKTHAMEMTIFRPSIVIGPRESKKTGGSITGLYGFIRELRRFRKLLQDVKKETRLSGNPDIEINFIPIDDLLDDIFYVVGNRFAGGHVFHLAAQKNTRVKIGMSMICEQMGIPDLVVTNEDAAAFSIFERLLSKRIAFYRSYLNSEKKFERSIPLQHAVDDKEFYQYVKEAVSELEDLETLRSGGKLI